jgi:hypothetical protein
MFGHKVLTRQLPPPDVAVRSGAERECTCGHRSETHDLIAGRYCAATKSSALIRGCICDTTPKASVR